MERKGGLQGDRWRTRSGSWTATEGLGHAGVQLRDRSHDGSQKCPLPVPPPNLRLTTLVLLLLDTCCVYMECDTARPHKRMRLRGILTMLTTAYYTRN